MTVKLLVSSVQLDIRPPTLATTLSALNHAMTPLTLGSLSVVGPRVVGAVEGAVVGLRVLKVGEPVWKVAEEPQLSPDIARECAEKPVDESLSQHTLLLVLNVQNMHSGTAKHRWQHPVASEAVCPGVSPY